MAATCTAGRLQFARSFTAHQPLPSNNGEPYRRYQPHISSASYARDMSKATSRPGASLYNRYRKWNPVRSSDAATAITNNRNAQRAAPNSSSGLRNPSNSSRLFTRTGQRNDKAWNAGVPSQARRPHNPAKPLVSGRAEQSCVPGAGLANGQPEAPQLVTQPPVDIDSTSSHSGSATLILGRPGTESEWRTEIATPWTEYTDDGTVSQEAIGRPFTTHLTGRSQQHLPDAFCPSVTPDKDDMRRRRRDRTFCNVGESTTHLDGTLRDGLHISETDQRENQRQRARHKKTEKYRSTRSHMNLFSRLSHEAQLAINETRREMALQDGIIDDADLEDGSSVEIELVPVIPTAPDHNPQRDIYSNSAPGQLYASTDNKPCSNGIARSQDIKDAVPAWRHEGCHNCSCQSRKDKFNKDNNINVAVGDSIENSANKPGNVTKASDFIASMKISFPKEPVHIDSDSSDRTAPTRTKLPRINTPVRDPVTPRFPDVSTPRFRAHMPGIGQYKVVPFNLPRKDTTFQITPVGYDSRYDQPLWVQDDTPKEIKERAIQKCSDWMIKYF